MSNLYVSDLDGTLLRSNEATSEYTNQVINSLVDKGMIFSYATARSLITAKKVTKGIHAKIPVIVYNGAFVIDNITEKILIANYFDDSVHSVLEDIFSNGVYPIVYAYINGKEKFSFVREMCTRGMEMFLESRKGDIRTNEVKALPELKEGNIFYITCIDAPEKLKPLYDNYKEYLSEQIPVVTGFCLKVVIAVLLFFIGRRIIKWLMKVMLLQMHMRN